MSQVVIIAGMHRSGTSMIARLLNLCGLYLGQENELLLPGADNIQGYWENTRFTLLNDALLSQLNGAWDYPRPVNRGWEKSSKFFYSRSEASKLIQEFSTYKFWGWKDPRNSLTFPFWKGLIPSVKIVVCVRNPLEVVHSLQKRNYLSPALSFHLWLEYNKTILLDSRPENRIITQYESYFHDPLSELTRILRFLAMDVPEDQVQQSLATVNLALRHSRYTFSDLLMEAPLNVVDLYQKMCEQTIPGWEVLAPLPESNESFSESIPNRDLVQEKFSLLTGRLRDAKKVIEEKNYTIQMLKAQLDTIEKDLAEIYQSKVWHFIQMVRKTHRKNA